jgi:hypothetical protein
MGKECLQGLQSLNASSSDGLGVPIYIKQYSTEYGFLWDKPAVLKLTHRVQLALNKMNIALATMSRCWYYLHRQALARSVRRQDLHQH